jgi:cytidine deaminase
MSQISDTELIKHAEEALNSQNLGHMYVADVGSALVAKNGHVFTGACIGGGLSICAEQSAASNMVSKTGPVITKIVAVWKDEHDQLFAVPPCGRCREFLRTLAEENLEADVILGKDHVVKLKELLPYAFWHAEKV